MICCVHAACVYALLRALLPVRSAENVLCCVHALLLRVRALDAAEQILRLPDER
jgi:hypothetical protein